MKKQFVTYEISLKLKELGFDEECLAAYEEGDLNIYFDINKNIDWSEYDDCCSAPLWSQCLSWLREKHNIDIIVKPWTGDVKGTKMYTADITIFGINTYKFKRHNSYEEALEEGLLEALKLIK